MKPAALALAGQASVAPVAKPRNLYHPELDALRFLAFFCVFIHHTLPREDTYYTSLHVPQLLAPVISSFVTSCGFGVDLFFILSSFLITSLLLREQDTSGSIDIRCFYIRRALRLWPLYLSFVVFAMLLPFISSEQQLDWRYGLGFLLFCGNWMVALGGFPQSVVFPLWSVSVEQQFYFVWPWAVRSGKRRRIAWVAVIMLAVALLTRIWLVAHHAKHESIWCNTFARLDPIAAGALMAIVLNGHVMSLSRRTRASLVAFGVVLLWAVGRYSRVLDDPTPLAGNLWGYPVATLACASILLAVLRPVNRPGGIGSSPSMVFMGRISYGLYMFHAFALWLSIYAISRAPQPLNNRPVFMILGFTLTTALGTASYYWLERPFLRLKNRFAIVTSRPVG